MHDGIEGPARNGGEICGLKEGKSAGKVDFYE